MYLPASTTRGQWLVQPGSSPQADTREGCGVGADTLGSIIMVCQEPLQRRPGLGDTGNHLPSDLDITTQPVPSADQREQRHVCPSPKQSGEAKQDNKSFRMARKPLLYLLGLSGAQEEVGWTHL